MGRSVWVFGPGPLFFCRVVGQSAWVLGLGALVFCFIIQSKIDSEKIVFSGQVLKPDGTEIISGHWEGLVGNPKDLGKMAGNEIKEKIDDSFFKQENFSH